MSDTKSNAFEQKNLPVDVIIATDCGSTTTKAIMIEKKNENGVDVYRQTFRGEAPTTVEAPFEDVTRGVLNAVQELEELSGRKIIDLDKVEKGADSPFYYRNEHPNDKNNGIDIYISTSSAGGGLQMITAGVVKSMTGESAQRAALGGGAIVMDILAINDKRLPHQRIETIRKLRPDMILLSGGTDNGSESHVTTMAELIASADPKPRLGHSFKLPVIYAGNKKACDKIKLILADKVDLTITDNLRPDLEVENLMPARQEIQRLFEEHVMKQAPGYDKLTRWVGAHIMPTPMAMGLIIQAIAKARQLNVVGVDIGGATTDVFSDFKVQLFGTQNFERIFNRSVSANLGMSYSVSNVMAEAGFENVMRWVPFDIEEVDLRNRIKNKMIRPTTIPQMLAELVIEQALAREALSLAFVQHKQLATGLKGVQRTGDLESLGGGMGGDESFIKMMDLDLLVGSGGVLSHAPRRNQSLSMMMDAYLPEGHTILAVDSIFMMPHLGVLSTVNKTAAEEVFDRDCMIYLGSTISAAGNSRQGWKSNTKAFSYEITLPDGKVLSGDIAYGSMKLIPELKVGERARFKGNPERDFDLGAGKGKIAEYEIWGGVVGVVLDGRGRPLNLPVGKSDRVAKLSEWAKELGAFENLSNVHL